MRFVIILVISLSLGACAESQQYSKDLLIDGNDDKVSAEEALPVNILVEASTPKDLSQMSVAELQAERKKYKDKITLLEADMASFSEDDPRWDILDVYTERVIELSRTETAAEKERTRKSRLLLGEDN
jgi:hypothetical protein